MSKDLIKLLGVGLILFAAGFLLESTGVAELSAEASVADKTHITHTTSDGLILHAWKSDAVNDNAGSGHRPGLALLLPMMAHTHTSYDPIIEQLNRANYTTIAFDLRGHGQSVIIGNDTIMAKGMEKEQFGKIPGDIDQFFKNFQNKHPEDYNYADVVVIGASIGANTAGLLADKEWPTRIVMLSPGRDYYGLTPESVLITDGKPMDLPVYMAVSIEDTYSAESCQWLFDNYTGPKMLKKYPRGLHGTSILEKMPDADAELLSWLRPKK